MYVLTYRPIPDQSDTCIPVVHVFALAHLARCHTSRQRGPGALQAVAAAGLNRAFFRALALTIDVRGEFVSYGTGEFGLLQVSLFRKQRCKTEFQHYATDDEFSVHTV